MAVSSCIYMDVDNVVHVPITTVPIKLDYKLPRTFTVRPQLTGVRIKQHDLVTCWVI